MLGVCGLAVVGLCILSFYILQETAWLSPQLARTPAAYTELYLVDHQSLPKVIVPGHKYQFGFVVVNHHPDDQDYEYEVSVIANTGATVVIDRGSLDLRQGETRAVSQTLAIESDYDRALVRVALIGRSEEVSFWVSSR